MAPVFEEGAAERDVYLPPGQWIDYQTGMIYDGGWHRIRAGEIQVILLVRDGAVLPHAGLAQSTGEIDWSQLELVVFSKSKNQARGKICLPSDKVLHELVLNKKEKTCSLVNDPLKGKVKWIIR